MDYETALDARIPRALAQREIEMHDARWSDFVDAAGEKEYYLGNEILDWLGY